MDILMRFLCFYLATAIAAVAGLTFEKTLLEFHPKPDDKRVVADFPFRNDTDKPVRIAKYDAACSCMEVGISGGKLDYAPGEAGVLRAIFRLDGYQGTTDRLITVWLDGDPAGIPSARLTLRAHIPQMIKVEPKTVNWDLNQAPEPRVISIEMAADQVIHVVATQSSNPNFLLELKTLKAGSRYELVITPKTTDSPGIAAFRIETDSKIEAHRMQSAFGVVRMPQR